MAQGIGEESDGVGQESEELSLPAPPAPDLAGIPPRQCSDHPQHYTIY